jgi:UDPglucose 6-dehydrogenase
VLALIKTAQDHGASLRIAEAVASVNDQRKRAMGRRIIKICGGDVRGKVIALLGLTFKPNTDDMREAPSISIARALQDAGAIVRAHDPVGMEQAKAVLDDVQFCASPYAAAEGADAAVIVTEWDMYRALDLNKLRDSMRSPILVDLRNVYARGEVEARGFLYHGIGCGGASSAADGVVQSILAPAE